MAEGLCGVSRPHHFRGVATTFVKLIHLLTPSVVVYSEHEMQRIAVIRQLIDNLFLPVEIETVPAVREADGLAADARNAYLDSTQRRDAAQIYAALLAGKRIFAEVGYSVQYGGVGYYAAIKDWAVEKNPELLTPAEREEWIALRNFWENEHTSMQAYDALSDEAKARLPETFMTAPALTHSAYPIPRVAGLQLDFSKLVELGLPGLRTVVRERRGSAQEELEIYAFLEGCLGSLDRLEASIRFYLEEARKLDSEESVSLVRALEGILDHAPETLHEGLQLIQIVAAQTATNNYGRLDVALGPLLSRDLEAGRLTWEFALRLMENFYTILEEEFFHTDARIIVGGMGRANEEDADRFALLAMETTERLSLPLPQLTLRFHREQTPALLAKAYGVIGQGKTFPMLYHDEVNVPAVEQAFGVDRASAEQYLPFGCGEYMLHHQSVGSPNAIINLMRCLESAMNHGRCLRTGVAIGPDLGGLDTYASYAALWDAYRETVDSFLD
ncbi:MAG: pantoate--beta-alanine ligase, partial [Pirellulales bacterium]|nr:pantoate--beta-alanine ligase [Pirellulales bacterium]